MENLRHRYAWVVPNLKYLIYASNAPRLYTMPVNVRDNQIRTVFYTTFQLSVIG